MISAPRRKPPQGKATDTERREKLGQCPDQGKRAAVRRPVTAAKRTRWGTGDREGSSGVC
jgi:hypothetical protein